MTYDIELAEAELDTAARLRLFTQAHAGRSGAVVSFTGLVRDLANGESVTALHLQHHPVMTKRAIQAFASEARQRWSLDGVCVVHRVGVVAAAESIVFVAAAGGHRRAAFEAADFLMDKLKQDVPLWKQERTATCARWVAPTADDQRAAQRW